jgi:formylmethanofuran dehydrogenase subunit E
MNPDEAGRVNEIQSRGKRAVCAHQRMVDDHYNEQGRKTGRLVCRECGEVIPDSVKA